MSDTESLLREAREWLSSLMRPYGIPNLDTNDNLLARIDAHLADKPAAVIAQADEPVTYCLVNLDGKMHLSESCIGSAPDELSEELEYLIDSEPDDGWHIAPLYARPVAAKDAARQVEAERSAENWRETAEQCQRNTEFYRGIVQQIGEMFGDAAKTSDDGSLQDSVLALKIPELVANLRAAAPAPKATTCTWNQDGFDRDIWATSCKKYFSIDEGKPSDNDMKFCVYCGKTLIESPYEDEADDE